MDAVEEVVDWKEVKCLRSERKLSIQLWTESGMGIWSIFDMREECLTVSKALLKSKVMMWT
jgi:hypothetical protein